MTTSDSVIICFIGGVNILEMLLFKKTLAWGENIILDLEENLDKTLLR